jgi:hypothetical protein
MAGVRRTAVFTPTVELNLDEDGTIVSINWDWADSYSMTLVDHEDSLEEMFEDEVACRIMDGYALGRGD